jgi:Arc/MetJ-type ribon-helix-helix transcriptional regulator
MSRQRLRLVTVKLPEEVIEAIDRAVKMLGYANRSEFIRTAVREKLERELGKLLQSQKGITNSPV